MAAYVYLDVGYGIGPQQGLVDFLIDTGSERSVLNPDDAHALLGDSLFEIDFENDPSAVGLFGIGQGSVVTISREMEVTLRDEDGNDAAFELDVQFARPEPFELVSTGNWLLPSLWGRDLLDHLDLYLSYNSPAVYLTTPEQ